MIKEYKLKPYPRRLWVAKNENFDKVKKKFKLNSGDKTLTNKQINSLYDAIVLNVIDKKTKYSGYLVFITNSYTDSVLVHEAAHVVFELYKDCSMLVTNNMDQEPFCYLLEHVYKLLKK